MSIFETSGVWRVVQGGLVTKWATLPEYRRHELDVPFWFGPHYNYGQTFEQRDEFIKRYRIPSIFEIVEVFREPHNDVDPSFRGRALLIARFRYATDALVFKMGVPNPEPSDFRVHL